MCFNYEASVKSNVKLTFYLWPDYVGMDLYTVLKLYISVEILFLSRKELLKLVFITNSVVAPTLNLNVGSILEKFRRAIGVLILYSHFRLFSFIKELSPYIASKIINLSTYWWFYPIVAVAGLSQLGFLQRRFSLF